MTQITDITHGITFTLLTSRTILALRTLLTSLALLQEELVVNIVSRLEWQLVGLVCTGVCKKWLAALSTDFLWQVCVCVCMCVCVCVCVCV